MAWSTDVDPKSVAFKIASSTDPKLRVMAGPGTGKSFAMKRRVARLLEEKVAPKKILAVTFTRVAADDLHRELTQIGVPGCEELQGRTLHSLAMRILMREHVFAALGRHPRPLSRFERKALICDLAPKFGGKKKCKKLIQEYESAWAQTQGDEPGFAKTDEEKAFSQALVSWLKFHRVMLIGEVIPYVVKYLHENPGAPERTEYAHVLVDEYQDLNKAEQSVISHLSEKAHVCIVGDDDQSIYSFKHAYPDGIREWPEKVGGSTDFGMDDCRRCPTTVVKMANALIAKNKNREERVLAEIEANGAGEVSIVQFRTLDAEATWIAQKIRALLDAGVLPGEIIVLVQRNVAGGPIKEALQAANVPAKSYYDENQLESEAAQERFALFRLFMDREDRAALRHLLGARHGDFRSNAYGKLRAYCEESGESPWEVMSKLASGALAIPHTGLLKPPFESIVADLATLDSVSAELPVFVDALLPEGTAILSELRDLAKKGLETCTTTEELMDFLIDEISQPDVPPAVDEVRVMSLHKSKGLSSPYVFIGSCVEGVLPQKPKEGASDAEQAAALEEARRLFYVGITRVKSDLKKNRPGSLFLTYARRIDPGAAHKAGIIPQGFEGGQAKMLASRFISELGPAAPKPIAG